MSQEQCVFDSSKKKTDLNYEVSEKYWADQPATVNGMLGGYDYVSEVDILQSQQFLNNFIKVKTMITKCGIVIFRFSKFL